MRGSGPSSVPPALPVLPTAAPQPLNAFRAVLVPDAGGLALSADFFRSVPHLRAEGVTHSLVLEGPAGAVLAAPLVVRPIEGTPYRDAVSPYGFPGALLCGGGEVPRQEVDWRQVDLVSIFLRDRIGGPYCFAGGTVRAEVSVIDPRTSMGLRRNHRCNIRRNGELGYATTFCPAQQCPAEVRVAFAEVYRQTMVRLAAHPRFHFPPAYFEQVFASPLAWLVMTRAPDGEVAAAALNVLSDGYLHNYLGGTGDAYLAHSPFKNVIEASTRLAAELGVALHLGSGVRPGDGLERFKRGFANATSRFCTHEIVCDPARYARLSAGQGDGNFFPAYRAPGRRWAD